MVTLAKVAKARMALSVLAALTEVMSAIEELVTRGAGVLAASRADRVIAFCACSVSAVHVAVLACTEISCARITAAVFALLAEVVSAFAHTVLADKCVLAAYIAIYGFLFAAFGVIAIAEGLTAELAVVHLGCTAFGVITCAEVIFAIVASAVIGIKAFKVTAAEYCVTSAIADKMSALQHVMINTVASVVTAIKRCVFTAFTSVVTATKQAVLTAFTSVVTATK